MKKLLFLIMALAAIPAFAVKVTTDGKHNLDKVAGKYGEYSELEIFEKSGKWYATKKAFKTETVPLVLEKDGKFSANFDYEKETYAYDTRMKALVKLVKDDTDQIISIELPTGKTKAAVDTNFNMNKVKGYWCDLTGKIVQKNGKWYIYNDHNDEYAPLTVTKNGFTIKSGDNKGIVKFTFDTRLQTLVKIDEDGNIVDTYILKDYCPEGYVEL